MIPVATSVPINGIVLQLDTEALESSEMKAQASQPPSMPVAEEEEDYGTCL